VRGLLFFDMTHEVYELLRMIYDAEKQYERITWHDNQDEVEAFRSKYGKAHKYLLDRKYIYGAISIFSELQLTEKGEQALEAFEKTLEEKNWEKERDDVKFRRRLIIAIVTVITTSLLGAILKLLLRTT